MGIIDVSFDRNSSYLAVSHMDSTIKVYPTETCKSKFMKSHLKIINVTSCKIGKYLPFRNMSLLVEI